MSRAAQSRRQFLKDSAVTVGGVSLAAGMPMRVWAAESATIRVGVIGCGGRGAGAAENCVAAAPGVKIVALADAFPDRLNGLKGKYGIPDSHCFVGLDAYRQLLARPDVDLVILATPPAFRPSHFTAAIDAGKHVFMEKPVAVCPAGVKLVSAAGEKAAQKKLAVVCGTQRRHQAIYVETMKRIHDGAIGDIISAQCYWNMGGLWVKKREPGQSDVEWQLRNWLYFTWLSGDHICEQHVHNIDVVNWAFKDVMPDMVHALGGRQFRTGPEFGNIFDHFGAEFTYPGQVRTISMCRQIDGSNSSISERVVGTKGSSNCAGTIWGENAWKYSGETPDPYVVEHADLIASIRAGAPLNEAQRIANSTLCAIMARESAYSGMQFNRTAFQAKCTLNLLPPDDLKLTDRRPVAPVAVLGKYQLPGLQG